ncbi:hypothetical protein GBA65_07090 [Rubrobacter marinus]|uniref:TrbL/VirB6 plasmid conjugal transfer protein n=1 Tax=Rubrobacter marinus TaxID=2653852 RepID=A0A6G8PVT6_9ACTN|nr:hypothetical protein [Rubrobacter marinus]QIN78320.1 hypothetical protein GBA65_07090 [Rubrobacter marinus]
MMLVLTMFLAFFATLPTTARAASPADEACRGWYGEQAPDEQAREDNEAQVGQDVDEDGCTGMLATPGSNGPVEGASTEEDTPEKDGASGGEEFAQAEGPPDAPGTTTGEGQPECAERFESDTPEEQTREREEDRQFNVDNDGDGCIAEEPAEDSTGMDGTPADAPSGEGVPRGTSGSADDGGLTGMVLGFFRGILQWLWDNTFGWALEQMAEAFETDLLSLPTLEGRGDLLGFYTGAVEKLRPAILVGILLLGILMMVRSDNYDLAYAGFQGLPKLMGVAMAMAFLPQFMGELSRITAGITDAFFPSSGDVNGAGQELFKAAVGNMAVANFLNVILLVAAAWVGMLVMIVALLKSVLYAVLFVAGPFALVASLVPGLSSLAGSWFRGVLACAAIPALWSIELGVGVLAVESPQAFFGEGASTLGFVSEGAVVAVGAILILWVMYKTPFKVIEWAFNVQLPGRGGLVGLAKTAASLAVGIPVKTAVASAVKSATNRTSSGSTGGTVTNSGGGSANGASPQRMPGRTEKADSGEATRRIQQARRQGQQARRAENVSRSTLKYLKQMDVRDEGKERFMQGRPRGGRDTGMGGSRTGDRSWDKR